MPNNNEQQYSSYQTREIPLVQDVFSRAGNNTKDAQYLNCFVDVVADKQTKQEDIALVKRPGTEDLFTIDTATYGEFRGMYYWERYNKLYWCTGNKFWVWDITTAVGTATVSSAVLSTTTGRVGFTEFLYDDGSIKLVWSDGTKLGTIDTSFTIVASADPDVPTPHVPDPVFLDGFLFVLKSGTQDLYNSNLNDPLAFTSGDFISAEMAPDDVLRLERISNYILVFGRSSIEYFWNSAQPSGSPLSRNDTFFKQIGYMAGMSKIGNRIYFLGNSTESGVDLFLVEDSKIGPMNNSQLKKHLAEIDTTQCTGCIITFYGHNFYALSTPTLTYIFDIDNQQVTNWAYKSNSNYNVLYAQVNQAVGSVLSNTFQFISNKIIRFSRNNWQDGSTNYTFKYVTPYLNFGNYNNKTGARLAIYGDQTNARVSVSMTDDDYQTFYGTQSDTMNQELVSFLRLGRFRRRAYKIETNDQYNIRIYKIDTDINMGIS